MLIVIHSLYYLFFISFSLYLLFFFLYSSFLDVSLTLVVLCYVCKPVQHKICWNVVSHLFCIQKYGKLIKFLLFFLEFYYKMLCKEKKIDWRDLKI